jgi:hypothetical protein
MSRLVIRSGFRRDSLALNHLLLLPALLGPVLMLVAGPRAVWGDAPGLFAMTAMFLPFALWRHRVVVDREAGRVVHTWGILGRGFGREEHDLAGLRLDESDPVPGNPRVRRTNVRLTDGARTILLREFSYAASAWRLSHRVAAFLGQPAPTGPAPKMASYLLSRILLFVSGGVGLIAGTVLFLAVLGWLGPALPAGTGGRIAAVLGLWLGSAMLGIGVLTSWAFFVPVGCPRCGGRARFRWSRGYQSYHCRDCGSSWRPGKGDGFNP